MKIVCASSVTMGQEAFSTLGETLVVPDDDIRPGVLTDADVLIAMRDPDTAMPDLPRPADIFVLNKCDLSPGGSLDGELPTSALHGDGIDLLERAVIERLGLDDVDRSARWAFTPTLREQLKL